VIDEAALRLDRRFATTATCPTNIHWLGHPPRTVQFVQVCDEMGVRKMFG
jgi:hypothetical protein